MESGYEERKDGGDLPLVLEEEEDRCLDVASTNVRK